mgnify:CR=1 FL=1
MERSLRPADGTASVLLPRPDLVAAVLATPPGGTCVLSAAPGSGRRTLLRQALGHHASRVRVGRRGDGVDAVRSELAQALDRAVPDRSALPSRDGEASRPWVVLEDVEPYAAPPVLEAVRDLIAECPESHRIALTTSHDVHGVVAGAARRGGLVQLDDADLALRPVQARELLAVLDPLMGDDEAEAVVALADGWFAALVAAGRRRAIDPSGDSSTWLAGRGAETLWGPWWDGLPADARTVLLDSAFVPVLEPGLVAELARSVPDAGSWLPRLARDRGPLRVAPSQHGQVAYRRHPLLTTMVRAHAAGRSDEAQLRRIAAGWYRANGELNLLVENLVAAGDRAEALAVVEEHVNDLMVDGRAETVRAWYDAIGPDGFQDAVDHYLRTGWAACLMRDRTTARVALSRLVVLTAAPGHDEDTQRTLRGEAAVLDSYLAQQEGDAARSWRSALEASDCFGPAWATNSHQFAPLLAARGLLATGDVTGAADALARSASRPFTTGAFGESTHPAVQAELAWVQGRVHASRTWAARQQRWLRLQEPDGWLQAVHGAATPHWLVAAEEGRPEEALDGLAEALENARTNENATDQVSVLLALADVRLTTGDLRGALDECLRARDLVLREAPNGGLLGLVLLAEARTRARAGDVVRAERILAQAPRSTEQQLLSVRIALQRGAKGVGRALSEVRAATPRQEVELALLLAWSQLPVSSRRSEQLLLGLADQAEEHGMTTVLVGAPDAVLDAARRTARHFVHDSLLALVRRAHAARLVAPTAPPGTALSRGELQLLALLPSRASNASLACELHVSVNTVKTRLRRLYLKLGVHDRDEAIAWARAHGLVGGADRG